MVRIVLSRVYELRIITEQAGHVRVLMGAWWRGYARILSGLTTVSTASVNPNKKQSQHKAYTLVHVSRCGNLLYHFEWIRGALALSASWQLADGLGGVHAKPVDSHAFDQRLAAHKNGKRVPEVLR